MDLRNSDGSGARWINSAESRYPSVKPRVPRIDQEVSKAVGATIYVNNPIVIGKVVEWKKQKQNPDSFDNFLADPEKVSELKQALNIHD